MVHKTTTKERVKKLLGFDILDKIADLFVVGKDPERLPRIGFVGMDYQNNEWVVGNIHPPYEERESKTARFIEGKAVAQYA